MNLKNIGKNVKQIRKMRKLTQERLAEAVNISTIHMSHIETGSVSMSLDCLLAVCNELRVTPNDILLGEFEDLSSDALKIPQEKIKKLTADEFLMLNKFADLLNELKINR